MSCEYKLFGVNSDKLNEFFKSKLVKYTAKYCGYDCLCKIDFSTFTENEKFTIISDFYAKFKDYIYAETNVSLLEQLVKILKIRNIKISTAESFTGGKIASMLTSISGASSYFYEGVVAYSEIAKIKRLGVNEKTISQNKAVSRETAYEMCAGLLSSNDADIVISTTGIAGPTSDNSNYPVGLAYIGVGSKYKISVYKYMFTGTREEIVNKGVQTALFNAVMALRDSSYSI